MGSKLKLVHEAWKVEVNCEQNDWDDIKCGGSAMIGYVFLVDADRDKKDIEVFIRKALKDLNRKKLLGVRFYEGYEAEELWDDEKMYKYIEENNFDRN